MDAVGRCGRNMDDIIYDEIVVAVDAVADGNGREHENSAGSV